jgi:hypothetical protein
VEWQEKDLQRDQWSLEGLWLGHQITHSLLELLREQRLRLQIERNQLLEWSYSRINQVFAVAEHLQTVLY